MTARPTTTTTYFGDVDTAALERLESSYDTTRLLTAVDIVDRVRAQLHDPEGLRDDLLEIHRMAHAVLNGTPSVPSRRDGTFPEQVLDALDLIDEFIAELTRVRTTLEPLEALYPNDEFGDSQCQTCERRSSKWKT
ncbi:transposase [Burkholderia vietnamiensis]|uniref:Tn3 family transposase post-transcriptional regulator TnpC n=1 Tax=Burkholderia vietnamiensis TaxID=60552 RepID=UPI0007535DB1|nr:Tn3 family transposase post-transcriptional regulator TnpC [Burkholderia vietnamiensis]KVF30421.1 transposase [Burkholderia vietnamiensis]KVF94471.1 transposase [Burkholderia vietnamiensis]